jgi:hypothetical protein
MTIGFEFPQSLKNSATTFQAAVRQPATTDPIDGPTRPPIGTLSTTTRSSGLALTEIRTMTVQFLQQVFNYQQIYDDKIWLLFIKLYFTSAETSAQSDSGGEPAGQIGTHALEPVCVE